MPLNLDIWHEIISYLEYPEDEPTLRSLALTSSLPSGPALDTIWRNGENSLAIVSVINWFATSPDGPFLEFTYEDGDSSGGSSSGVSDRPPRKELRRLPRELTGAWVLNRPLPHASRTRALEYLARIKKLTLFQPLVPRKEELLWPVLAACLDSPGPLLPHLRHLEIDKAVGSRVDCLSPLLSPALKILKITTTLLLEDKLALPILYLAKARGCDLEVFTYDGGPIWRTPGMVVLFKNLRDVQIPLDYPFPQESPITVVEFLTSLPSLHSLACNLAVFLNHTTEDTFYQNTLQKVHILSPTTMLHEFFRSCTFPSVVEAKISKDDFEVMGFEDLDSCFPNVRKLELRVTPITYDDDIPSLDLKHLAPLLSLPIQVFDLIVTELNLTPADFRTISGSWPDLYSFKIWSTNHRESDVLPSLAAFSGHPHLGHLDLKIRLRHLLDAVTEVPALMAAHVPIQKTLSNPCTLYFTSVGEGLWPIRGRRVTTRAEKRMLVDFLLLQFPNLKELVCKGENTFPSQAPAGLQEILLELKKEREESTGFV